MRKVVSAVGLTMAVLFGTAGTAHAADFVGFSEKDALRALDASDRDGFVINRIGNPAGDCVVIKSEDYEENLNPTWPDIVEHSHANDLGVALWVKCT